MKHDWIHELESEPEKLQHFNFQMHFSEGDYKKTLVLEGFSQHPFYKPLETSRNLYSPYSVLLQAFWRQLCSHVERSEASPRCGNRLCKLSYCFRHRPHKVLVKTCEKACDFFENTPQSSLPHPCAKSWNKMKQVRQRIHMKPLECKAQALLMCLSTGHGVFSSHAHDCRPSRMQKGVSAITLPSPHHCFWEKFSRTDWDTFWLDRACMSQP